MPMLQIPNDNTYSGHGNGNGQVNYVADNKMQGLKNLLYTVSPNLYVNVYTNMSRKKSLIILGDFSTD